MKFKCVYIEISDICSCFCSFCPSPKYQNRRKIMDLALFERILNEISPHAKFICLHILGDPLEVRNLGDYVDLVAKFGLKIDFVTTGKNLTKNHYKMLAKSPFHQISFSLSAFFDKNNKFGENFTQNLVEFCNFVMAQNSDIFVNLRIQSDTILKNSEKMQEFLEILVKNFHLNGEEFWGEILKIRQNFAASIFQKNTRIRLSRRIFLNFKKSFLWQNLENKNLPQNPAQNFAKITPKFCHALKNQIGFLSDGIVVPCCLDYSGALNLGNIKTQNLSQILASKRAQNIKQNFAKGVANEPYCKKCGFEIGVS